MKELEGRFVVPLISTISERCRVCYTCVRECPAKAIRISGGQAQVIPGRCIGCGNCVRVCRQNAKTYASSIDAVKSLLDNHSKVSACIAPSFTAEFWDIDYRVVIGSLRDIGFEFVQEVAFGADLVAKQTMEIFNTQTKKYISTSCPAVVEYVKCYQPNLVEHLSPIVSPMVAMARVVKQLHGEDTKVVFIGPCIAKKGEALDTELFGEVDEVLTFQELREILKEKEISFESVIPSEFDAPLAGKGTLFPLARGMTQSVEVYEDLMKGDIITADGREGFIEALKEFESGDLDAKLLELLCCKGCMMGAGMTTDEPQFRRRSRISKYARQSQFNRDKEKWAEEIKSYENIDLTRYYLPNDQRTIQPSEDEIKKILQRLGKFNPSDELNCGACGYDSCRAQAAAIYEGWAEVEMCLPFTIEKLHKTVSQLGLTNDQLASTRDALNQSEKLASMGQLAAGIAHELNNPLGVVLMYANLVLEDLDKSDEKTEDLKIIAAEAERCKKIVSDLLNFARKNKVTLLPVNICDLVDQTLKVTSVPETINLQIIHKVENPIAEMDRDQIVQVLNNLIGNAITAMAEVGSLTIKTKGGDKNVEIIVKDSGHGISEKNIGKIFQPFFTTKQMGKGTGLGLAVSYGIIKMHRGSIKVNSNDDPKKGETGTTFIVTLPRKAELG
jgi:signal transduction histidine kinase/iron only hydrogenase large subunit-like protein